MIMNMKEFSNFCKTPFTLRKIKYLQIAVKNFDGNRTI